MGDVVSLGIIPRAPHREGLVIKASWKTQAHPGIERWIEHHKPEAEKKLRMDQLRHILWQWAKNAADNVGREGTLDLLETVAAEIRSHPPA